MNTQEPKIYKFRAFNDIWTGDAKGKPDRTITTGLLGSIRWWFEVLVRGLGGSACDPTSDRKRCPNHRKRPTDPGHHCVVCELFGCTGWARKFRFEVLDKNGQAKTPQIRKNETFKLRFTPLRPIRDEEWTLLDVTLRIIANYGALSGKTVFKPSDEQSRANAAHHRDYGLVEIVERPGDLPTCGREQLESYIGQERWPKPGRDGLAWASLANFWFVKGWYLARQDANNSSFQDVVGRKSDKSVKEKKGKRSVRWSDLLKKGDDEVAKWLAGTRQESKKVFSFKQPQKARRTFGFVKPDLLTLDDMRKRLKGAWPDLNDEEFVTGPAVFQGLLAGSGEGAP